MEKKDHEAEEDIKVTDKRRFTKEGEAKQPDVGSKEPHPQEKHEEKAEKGREAFDQKLPPLDFATFVLSLATSAQVHLGAIPNPTTGKQEQNLPIAKETIDLLDILRDKTKGNLTSDEERLFEHVLYDLRMMYVERNKK
ncbi:MAG: DUF1844 domain-containing protein [Pseudomonadota bacterium]